MAAAEAASRREPHNERTVRTVMEAAKTMRSTIRRKDLGIVVRPVKSMHDEETAFLLYINAAEPISVPHSGASRGERR